MGRHTVVAIAGRRVEVQPCKTNAGLVQVSIIGADRQAVAVVTLTADAAAILSQALAIEGQAAEDFEARIIAAQVAAVPVVVLPVEVYKPNPDKNCDCGAASHVGAFRPPCTCHTRKPSKFGGGASLAVALDRFIAAGV